MDPYFQTMGPYFDTMDLFFETMDPYFDPMNCWTYFEIENRKIQYFINKIEY